MARKGRFQREEIEPIVHEIEVKTKGLVSEIAFCGSYRRGLKTLGDLDVVVVPVDYEKFHTVALSLANEVLADGPATTRILTGEKNIQVDFMISSEESFQAACLHMTGSQWFNIKCRQIAKNMGLRLSQYGLFSVETGERVSEKELDILTLLGMKQFTDPVTRSL